MHYGSEQPEAGDAMPKPKWGAPLHFCSEQPEAGDAMPMPKWGAPLHHGLEQPDAWTANHSLFDELESEQSKRRSV